MDKPLSVSKKEFTQNLVSLINNAKLPPCLVEEILGGIFNEVKMVAEKQYQNDLVAWQNSNVEVDNLESNQ